MAHTVTWEDGTEDFDTEEEAKAAARSMKGIVLVNHKPSGSVTTYRDGRELEGAEATKATLEFQNRQGS
jgi:hypothetical protein